MADDIQLGLQRQIETLERKNKLLEEGLHQAERLRLMFDRTAQELKATKLLLVRHGAELAESENRFRAVAQSANDAIITAAGGGNIVGWNAAAERLFGYAEAEIIGQSMTVLIPERFRSPHSTGMARVVAGGAPHVIGKTAEWVGQRKDGSEFPLEISLAQWQAADGKFFTAIIRDISERKQAEARHAEQLEELRRWHDVTSGREGRILELKHEVNKLLGEAGRPLRYPSAESDDQQEK